MGDITVTLNPGDALVLYTDTVIEARAGQEQLESQRLIDTVGSAAGEPAAALVTAIDITVQPPLTPMVDSRDSRDARRPAA